MGPALQSALNVSAFGSEVLFPLSGLLWGDVEEEILIAQLTPDLWRSVEIFALCLELLKREKEVFSADMKTETLICFARGLPLF